MRFAVVGIGRMGSKHADNLAKGRVKGARLAAVCDTDERVLERCARRYPRAARYADWRALIASGTIDALIVATPHYAHVEIAAAAIASGIHTLVEKPISVACLYASELNAVAAQHPQVVFGIMYNQRTNRVYAQVREWIVDGKLGNVVRASMTVTDWYRTQYYYDLGGWRASWKGEGGGTLINQCVHQLDLLQWILGMPQAITAHCKTVNRAITTENDVTALLEYPDFHCTFHASTHEYPGTNRLEIACEKGKIIAHKHSARVTVNRYAEREINARATKDYGNRADKKSRTYRLRYGWRRWLRDVVRGQQCNILNDFARAVAARDGSRLIAPGQDGIRALGLINGMYLSSWLGEKTAMPVDEALYARMLAEKAAQENDKNLGEGAKL